MFKVVVTGRGKTAKLHAQTLDGRRLCRCKYKVVTFTELVPAPLGPGDGTWAFVCPDSERNTRALPSVYLEPQGTVRLGVQGLGVSLYARDLDGARELLGRMGFGAYRRVDGHATPRRVLTIAEREEQRSQLMATHGRMRYWGD